MAAKMNSSEGEHSDSISDRFRTAIAQENCQHDWLPTWMGFDTLQVGYLCVSCSARRTERAPSAEEWRKAFVALYPGYVWQPWSGEPLSFGTEG